MLLHHLQSRDTQHTCLVVHPNYNTLVAVTLANSNEAFRSASVFDRFKPALQTVSYVTRSWEDCANLSFSP